jgi:hypothetical protein
MANDLPVIDQYSGLSHKVGMDTKAGGGGIDMAPDYWDAAGKRRLNAYARLAALAENVGRLFVKPDPTDPAKADSWREFGDAGVLVRQIATSVLGDEPAIVVPGADVTVPDAPDIPKAPVEPVDDGTLSEPERAIRTRVFAESLRIWEENANQTLDGWLEQLAERPKLETRQDWLRDWADRDRFLAKVTENEIRNIVPLGDGVYVFSWDPGRGRVKTEIYEPDVYAPVLDAAQQDFPTKVHLVWITIKRAASGKDEEWVRRITWELIEIASLDGGGADFDLGPEPKYLAEGETRTHVCVQSDGEWPLKAFQEMGVGGEPAGGVWRKVRLPGSDEEIEVRNLPTGLDFLPVLHVPHTLSTSTHFGQSPLTPLAQLLDEIAAADTDEAMAAEWAARPPLGVSGLGPPKLGEPDQVDIRPGKGFRLSDQGRVTVVEMAANLEKLGQRIQALLKRLSVNGSVPEGILGRVDASEVPSGLALTLSFTAFQQMIKGARLARSEKYPLALKMVQRIAIQNDDPTLEGSTEVFPAEIRFGSFMPQDLAGVASVVASLFQAHLVSLETALAALQEAGLPVEDFGLEIASIKAMMGELAEQIFASTGRADLAGQWLGYTAEDLAGPATGSIAPPATGIPPGGETGLPGAPGAPGGGLGGTVGQ